MRRIPDLGAVAVRNEERHELERLFVPQVNLPSAVNWAFEPEFLGKTTDRSIPIRLARIEVAGNR